jgi:hypothetical protein
VRRFLLEILNLLQSYELLVYAVAGILALFYLRQIYVARQDLRRTIFGLEREALSRRQNRAITMLIFLGLATGLVFAAVNYALPQVRRTQLLQSASSTQIPLTPTPTPLILYGVDLSGCTNPHATIKSPTPGQAVQGTVDIRGSADIPDFAFWKYELGNPQAANVWVTLKASNRPVTDGVLGTWDSTTVPPGVYQLRLTVTDSKGNSPKPCVVPLQVLGPSH